MEQVLEKKRNNKIIKILSNFLEKPSILLPNSRNFCNVRSRLRESIDTNQHQPRQTNLVYVIDCYDR